MIKIFDFLEINLIINQKLYIFDIIFRILYFNFYYNYQINIIRVYNILNQQHVCFFFFHEYQWIDFWFFKIKYYFAKISNIHSTTNNTI